MVLAGNSIVKKIEPVFVVLSFLIIWEIVSVFNIVSPLVLPEPIKIIKSLYHMIFTPVGGATLIVHIWASLEKFFIGFIVAASLGAFLGIWMGWSEKVNSIFSPLFQVIRFIPPVAWISFAILWFGMGLAAQSYIIGIGVFIPVLENSRLSIKMIDPIYIQVARVFGVSDRTIFWKVLLPAGLPLLIAGVRIGMGIGWMCLVAAEMISRPTLLGGEGLGYLIETSRMTLRSEYIIGGMLLIGLIGYCLDVVIRYLEKVLCPWRR